ncbi:NAD-dependent epimerase/dehydratase family protein [Mucilaginibacter pocheonensis]|uniref:Nucleoside-diphosphate-sugar epimerase n=1 Tax=Mucilaginibacter pocheonensis TaxID=398050 RepID=A0ABU1T763_9SPHI|nr:NAD(P)-dependent oxidoreductase [Mucilaginibacter pocheonensis]MDR6941229.1 nucleoside-diphosphate-sugar epimerase [Mucilaginibacter pocheonensis]
MKQRVLITGASGFVGYHLIEEALHHDLEVYAAIRKSSQTDHLKHLDINYVYLDYKNPVVLKQQLTDINADYIIHAAGVTSARSQAEYNYINATHTYNLASIAAKIGGNLKKFVLIGSLAAVGPLKTLTGIITEATPPQPVTAYGRSKLLAEEQLRTVKNLNYTILRPTAVYGPRDTGIFIFFKQIVKGIEPYIGKAPQKLSFIYVEDVAKAAIKALYGGDYETFNLSDGNFYGKYELGDIAKEVLNLKTLKFHLPVNFVKIIAVVSEKVSYLRNKAAVVNIEKIDELMAVNWSCDNEKAKLQLGFYPKYNLQSGLAETLTWYKANKWL